MSVVTVSRRASTEEIATEMDRRGGVITYLESKNAAKDATIAELVKALEATAQLLKDHTSDPTTNDGWKNEECRDVWLAARAALSRARGGA